ncbi:hypothetical protein BJ878DRAFT_545330 [Calycina marina]|uniref:Uncharacterized protein n=1 Tax=Calycina marina TaxID=1763456 RepID=A0A9P7YX47_9HELO|nr:hypothetical protein BJ878DRAFT_545330 [Calycina marina]
MASAEVLPSPSQYTSRESFVDSSAHATPAGNGFDVPPKRASAPIKKPKLVQDLDYNTILQSTTHVVNLDLNFKKVEAAIEESKVKVEKWTINWYQKTLLPVLTKYKTDTKNDHKQLFEIARKIYKVNGKTTLGLIRVEKSYTRPAIKDPRDWSQLDGKLQEALLQAYILQRVNNKVCQVDNAGDKKTIALKLRLTQDLGAINKDIEEMGDQAFVQDEPDEETQMFSIRSRPVAYPNLQAYGSNASDSEVSDSEDEYDNAEAADADYQTQALISQAIETAGSWIKHESFNRYAIREDDKLQYFTIILVN